MNAGSSTGTAAGIRVDLGPVHVSRPFDRYPSLLFGRTAVRGDTFAAVDSATGATGPDAGLLIGAAAGTDEPSVRLRARGELVERMSNILAARRAESRPETVSYARLARQGVAALDPAAWAELSVLADIRERPMVWVAGGSLVSGAAVLVPACAAFLRHRPPDGQPAAMTPGSAGLSAHLTQRLASRHGLLEVLERDLFCRAWYGDGTRAELPGVGKGPAGRALGLQRTAILLPGPGGTACLVVCLAEPGGSRQSFGARAVADTGPTALAEALEVGTDEALMVRWSMRTPSAESGWQQLARTGTLPGALGHALHAFYRQDSLSHLLRDPKGEAGHTSDNREADDTATLVHLLAEHTGDDVVWVDCTVAGLTGESEPPGVVGRVVAPGARRLPHATASPLDPSALGGAHHPPHPLG
ncbi:MAG TPA: YcaO-like family protein [Pseudonocardia sp.]|uniref:YcaO-like family protein n=1 Tax=Pseudonocardia sp. TaxID=60912 RepID=UPI002F41C2E0